MSSEETPPTSKAQLNAELKALLLSAHKNGLDVEGGFACRNGVEHPDWDIIVTEVESRRSDYCEGTQVGSR